MTQDRAASNTSHRAPAVSMDALLAHQRLTNDLHQWAPQVHHLVCERITALLVAMEPRNHPIESDEDYVRRILADGQYPFPAGVSMYDDLSSNETYAHVTVGYGLVGEDGPRVTFTGRYPKFDETGESYVLVDASIHCPASVMSEPDGVAKFRARTQDMVQALIARQERESAELDALLRGYMRH